MTRVLYYRSIRATALVVAAVASAAVWSLTAQAAPGTVADTPPVAEAARATAPAQRLRVVPPENFPMAPNPRCEILDNFGDSRGGRSHEGVDILATKGQEVYAMVDGTLTLQVVAGSTQSGASLSGNLWKLEALTGGTYYTYAHLSGFAPGLAKGSRVVKGQVIGYVGDTGNPGPGNYHLHFEVHPGGGAAVDPLPLLRPVPPSCKVF